MKKYVYCGLVAAVFVTAVPLIKAIEPISMVVGAVVITGVSKAVDGLIYLFGPSKSDQEYKKRHDALKTLSKKDFIDCIKYMRDMGNQSDIEILAQHELYRYENFLEAVKELIPNYNKCIKALMVELDNNPKARLVRGFETDHLYHKGAGLLRKRAKDFSEFYKLIKKLYDEVLLREQQAMKQSIAVVFDDEAPAPDDVAQPLVTESGENINE